MNGQNREDVFPGRLVDIILKKTKELESLRGDISKTFWQTPLIIDYRKVDKNNPSRDAYIMIDSSFVFKDSKEKDESSQVFHTNENASLLPY